MVENDFHFVSYTQNCPELAQIFLDLIDKVSDVRWLSLSVGIGAIILEKNKRSCFWLCVSQPWSNLGAEKMSRNPLVWLTFNSALPYWHSPMSRTEEEQDEHVHFRSLVCCFSLAARNCGNGTLQSDFQRNLAT